MARIERLSYKETTRSKIQSRIRQLFVLLLSAIIGILISVTVNAQSSKYRQEQKQGKYKDACTILAKKRYAKPSKHSYHRKKVDYTSQPTAAVKTSGKSSVIAIEPGFQPSAMQVSIIREMVALHLQEQKTGNPIELAPLHFRLSEDKLTVEDINPFLIAAEFALQGRVLQIQPEFYPASTTEMVNELRAHLSKMGVPDERIMVVNNQRQLRAPYDETRMERVIGFTAF